VRSACRAMGRMVSVRLGHSEPDQQHRAKPPGELLRWVTPPIEPMPT